MNPTLAKRALEILDGAHELSDRELESYVEQVCGEDSLLRREVLRYLDFDVERTLLSGVKDGGSAPEIPVAPRSEGRYELAGEIASGGMGVVLRAFDSNLNRDVAVKVLRSEWQDKPDVVRRFLQEAQIGAQLQHPGIASVYEIGRLPDGRPFIAMKLVKGVTLEQSLALRQGPGDDQAKYLGVFEQVCQTIAFAHQRGVIHRDLKPSNVMVGEFGEVQVMDWGIAKLLGDDHAEVPDDEGSSDAAGPDSRQLKVDTDGAGQSTRVGQLMGSPAYMAPEQSIGRADKTADVFSLGAMLFEILTGEKASERRDAADEQLNRCGCDPTLAELAKECLQLKEADRPRNAGVVAERISAHFQQMASRLKDAEIATARAEVRVEEERKRRHRTLWTIAGAAALLMAAGLIIVLVRNSAHQRSLRERTKTIVTTLSTSDGLRVPHVIEDLQELPNEMALAELRRQFDAGDETRKLRLAFGLASVGDVKIDLLVSQVATVSPDEVDNLVQALGKSKDEALSALEAAARAADDSSDWRLKSRLAMLSLQLNAPTLATDMCQPRSDSIQRTLFIEECSTWHGDLRHLASMAADVGDGPLRSALALSVGSVPTADLTNEDRQAWRGLLSDWYQTAPDTGTHGAAGWTLRRWNVELPVIAASNQPSGKCRWYVNSVGMTMLELSAGSFVRRDEQVSEVIERKYTVSKSFLLGDREVTRAQFEQFIDDPLCPQEEKPVDFDGVSIQYCPTEQHPIHNVTWFAAVRFCNWLSRREGLNPCYVRTGQKQTIDGGSRTYDVWKFVAAADGYRLPTEVEWEYACRAGSATVFHFGDDHSLLDRYAVQRAGRPEPAGTKMPNAWGLFDMHGNVWEWCQDWDTDFTGDLRSRAPRQISHLHRAQRGGTFLGKFTDVRSAVRISMEPDSRGFVNGFRVARNCP